jgi:hypothetical protein
MPINVRYTVLFIGNAGYELESEFDEKSEYSVGWVK